MKNDFANNKKNTLLSLTLILCFWICSLLFVQAQDGAFDLTFNGTGTNVVDLGVLGEFREGAFVKVQSNNKIISIANLFPSPRIIRLNEDGTVDNDFGLLEINNANVITDLEILDNDKFLVSEFSGYLWRYNENGTQDNTFNSSFHDMKIREVIILSDGKILLVGETHQFTSLIKIQLRRLNSDGTVDTSFGVNGNIIFDYSTETTESGRNVVIQNDGKILLTANIYYSGSIEKIAIIRFHNSGDLDTSFGNNGVVELENSFNLESNDFYITNNKILSIGTSYIYANQGVPVSAIVFHRLNLDGTPDTGFGTNGKMIFDLQSASLWLWLTVNQVSVLDDENRILISLGSDQVGWNAGVLRFNSDGTLDTSFGTDGFKEIVLPTQEYSSSSLTFDHTGRIVIAAHSAGDSFQTNISVSRLKNSGGPCSVSPPFGEWPSSICQEEMEFTVVTDGFTSPNGKTWDFGDGTITNGPSSISHAYSESGTYQVCVTAFSATCTANYCQNVSFANSPPVFDNVPDNVILDPTDLTNCWNDEYQPFITAEDPCDFSFPPTPVNIIYTRNDNPDINAPWPAGQTITITATANGAAGTSSVSWNVEILDCATDCANESVSTFSTFFSNNETTPTSQAAFQDVLAASNGEYISIGYATDPLTGSGSNLIFQRQNNAGTTIGTFQNYSIGTPGDYLATFSDGDPLSRDAFIEEAFDQSGVSMGYYIATSAVYADQNTGSSSYDAVLILVDHSGNEIWTEHLDIPTTNEGVRAISFMPQGNPVLIIDRSNNTFTDHHLGLWVKGTNVIKDFPLTNLNTAVHEFYPTCATTVSGFINPEIQFAIGGQWKVNNENFVGVYLIDENFGFLGTIVYDLMPGTTQETVAPTSINSSGDSITVHGYHEIIFDEPASFGLSFLPVFDFGPLEAYLIWSKEYYFPTGSLLADGLLLTDCKKEEGSKYVSTGIFALDSDSDYPFFMKTNSYGDLEFINIYTEGATIGDFGETVLSGGLDLSSDGGYFLHGTFVDNDLNKQQLWTSKLDDLGGLENCECLFNISVLVQDLNPVGTASLYDENSFVSFTPIDPVITFNSEDFTTTSCSPLVVSDFCGISSCNTDTLFLNTGYDPINESLSPIGSYDNYWTLTTSPTPNLNVPFPAAVINPHPAWGNQQNTRWISAYPYSSLTTNNYLPLLPYTFQNCFCTCGDATDVDFNLSVYADDRVTVSLKDADGNLIQEFLTHIGHGDTPGMINETISLPEGNYCLTAELRNTGGVAMGINIKGYITGASVIDAVCCNHTNGTILGTKFRDKNCDGIRNNPNNTNAANHEEGLPGWEISLCDNDLNVIATTTTDPFGFYIFNDVPPGTYIVKETPQLNWEPTNTVSVSGHQVSVGTNETISNINFANKYNGPVELLNNIDCVIPGEEVAIQWDGPDCDCDIVIRTVSCGPVSVTQTIATIPTNAGGYTWVVPDDLLFQSYHLLLEACNGTESISSQCFDVVDFDLTVEANDTGCEGEINFTANSNASAQYIWDFGDADYGEGYSVSHIYENAGTYEVTVTAIAINGCTQMATITVSPSDDTTAPICFGDQFISVLGDTDLGGAIVNFQQPFAVDDCSQNLIISCDPPSGSFFPCGMTTVVCSVTDEAGNVGFCSITVEVSCPTFTSPYCGQSVITCYSENVNSNPVAAIKDLSLVPFQSLGVNISGAVPVLASWTKSQLGEVFGIAIDDDKNIYFSATTVYGAEQPGPLGSGGVYKINGNDLTIDPTWTASLPNFSGNCKTLLESGCGSSIDGIATPGLGNLCFDKAFNRLLVTNFEDGAIYTIDVNGANAGVPIMAYNPNLGGPLDLGNDGFAVLGERIWGIGTRINFANQTEVYYAVWSTDMRFKNDAGNGLHNTIRMVKLDAGGTFVAGTDVEVISIPFLNEAMSGGSCNYPNPMLSCPVSDIAFSKDGETMLLAERAMHGDIRTSTSNNNFMWAHNGRVLKYKFQSAVWVLDEQYNIGSTPNPSILTTSNNSAGGIDFANGFGNGDLSLEGTCDSVVWATGDYLHQGNDPQKIYGMQGFAINDPNISNVTSYLIDFNGNTGGFGDKTSIGDVEIIKCGSCIVQQDCTPQFLSCPQDVQLQDNSGSCDNPYVAFFTVYFPCEDITITDIYFPNGEVTFQRSDGNPIEFPFPIGNTEVIATATSSNGQTATCVYIVTVIDVIPPIFLDCPDGYFETAQPGQTEVDITTPYPIAIDDCSNVTVVCDFFDDQNWPCDTTVATCIATDGAGNTAVCSFNVIVTCEPDCDNANVTISGGATSCNNVFLEANTTGLTEPITYQWGNLPPGAIAETPNQQSTNVSIPAGLSGGQICVIANDGICPAVNACFNFTMPPNLPIFQNCQDYTFETTIDNCSAFFDCSEVIAIDGCTSALVPIVCVRSDGGSLSEPYPLGTTVIIATATNNAGETSICEFTITVQDNTPPTIVNCPPDITICEEPNGQTIYNFNLPTFADNCDSNNGLTITCTPPSGSVFPLGATTVFCTATDQSGNVSAACTFEIIVEPCNPCCQPETEFCAKFDQGFYASKPAECSLKLCTAALDSCDLVSINWGDMNTDQMAGNECMTHTYSASGDYDICLTVQQLQMDNTICNQKDTCWTVCIECESCDQPEWNHFWSKGTGSISDATGLSNYVSHAYDLTIKNDIIYSAGMIESNDLDGMPLESYGGLDAYVAKHTLDGVPLWAFTIGSDLDDGITAIDVDPNTGDIYIGGWFKGQTLSLPSPGAGTAPITLHKSTMYPTLEDGFYAKYDADRNLQWAYSFGDLGYDMVMDLVVDHDGNIALTGSFWYNVNFYGDEGIQTVAPAPLSLQGGEVEIFVLKINPQGHHIWTRVLGDPLLQDWGNAIAVDESNDIYVSGQYRGDMQHFFDVKISTGAPSTRTDAFVAKFSQGGNFKWAMDISHSEVEAAATNVAFDLAIHNDKLIITGQGNGMSMNFNPAGTPYYLSGNSTGNLHAFLACYDVGIDPDSIPPLDWAFLLWTNGQSNDLSVNAAGDIAITGSSFRPIVDFDPSPIESNTAGIGYQDQFIAKYTIDGEYINALIFGGNFWDKSHAVEWDDNGNVYSIGKFGSPDFDAEPFNPENELFSAEGGGKIFMGKYGCFCEATETCCDNLDVIYEAVPSDLCCYSLDIENNYGTSIYQVQAEIISENWSFTQATIPFLAGYDWGSTNNGQLLSIVHDSGVIPSGEISDILSYCVVPLDPSNMEPIEIVIKWWEGFPNNKKKIICRDTLLLDCNIIDEEPCLDFNLIEAVCNPENPLEYDLFYTVTNVGDAEASTLILENLSDGFVFGSCTNGGTTSNEYFENINLAPNETSNTLCVSISSTQPILETTQLSLTTGYIGSICCHSNIEQFFEITPCCLPCEQVSTSIEANSECCYSFGLSSECNFSYFTNVVLEIENENVLFNSFENSAPNDWEMSSSNSSSIVLTPTAGFIQAGTYNEILTFCLEGNPSGSGDISIKFYKSNGDGTIEVVCQKMSSVECNIEQDSCVTISDVTFLYNPDEGYYDLTFDVVNNSNFDAHYLILNSPLEDDISFGNSFFSINNPALAASGGSTSISTTVSTNPFPYPNSIPISVSLKNVINQDCCLENPDLIVVNVKEKQFSQDVAIYPNPFTQSFTILFGKPIDQTIQLQLRDLYGRVIYSEQIKSGSKLLEVQTNDLASGVYFLEFKDMDGNVAVRKMIKI